MVFIKRKGTSQMTLHELGKILNEMYSTAAWGEKTATAHLFGIIYAGEINKGGYSAAGIAREAGLHDTVNTEVSAGIKLSQYVTPK
ncbi:MAG: hypothetical protein LBN34_05420 [Clostridiales Family XIII bacterium]|jgi:hypothetical protein|nr:hypothetical protein [Clostridiales Family XIII bacterium]